MSLAYRPYLNADLPGLLALWEASGWGAMDEATWRDWFLTTPHGPAIVIVAVDGDDILGQMVFTPALLDAEGGPYRAVRLAAPILHPSIRRGSARSREHPAVRLFFAGMDAAASAGFDVIYAQPERVWLAFFRWGFAAEHFATIELGCSARTVEAAALPSGWRAEPATAFSEAHRALWEAARGAFPIACGVQRTPPWLRYRIGAHAVVEMWQGDALRGYVAVRDDGLVMDAVAATPAALAEVLAATVPAAAAFPDRSFSALKVMRTEAWAAPLAQAGFGEEPYSFVLAVCPLSERFPAAAADPAAWYAVPAD